jgi:catechol 2,3-dioxygenase-like lactoylglutathione lyase family enzyme
MVTEAGGHMVTKLNHANILVLDQKKAYEVYVNILGFKVHTDMVMEGGFRWLTLTAPGAPDLELIIAEPSPPMFEPEDAALLKKLLEHNAMGAGVFECDDCRKTCAQLKAKGIEFSKEPTEEFYGIEAVFKDGCGNWFSLTQPKAQS